MVKRSLLLITLLLLMSTFVFAQSRKSKKRKTAENQQIEQPSALDPGESHRAYAPKTSRKKSKGPTYESERQFYERMEALEKTKRKNEKLAAKPQYSDPMYFGHKKPPKKRKPSKMKYCKECGIRH